MSLMEKISKEIKDTKKIAETFLRELKGPRGEKATVIGLYGDLGTGKTTFTNIFAKGLGIKRKVNSPTFVIMKKYPIPKSSLYNKFKYFIHIDAYRIKKENELSHLGWDEIIGNKEHLVFIEWPENIIKAMPKGHHKIQIRHTKEGHRKFKIKKA